MRAMYEVTTYEVETGREVWTGAVDVLVAASRSDLTDEEVRRLEELRPGEQVEVGMGFRVRRAGPPRLSVVGGGGG